MYISCVYLSVYIRITSFQPYWLCVFYTAFIFPKIKMADIFDNPILCKKCNKQMQKQNLFKNGFKLRMIVCPKCNDKVIHPIDEAEYNKFINLKNREFKVKMRLVGNSYAVSIPREIVNFMNEQEKMMDDMVRLCFEEAGRLSLNFDELMGRRK